MTIPFDLIIFSDRIRQDYGDITDLADSIYTKGLIQSLCVRKDTESNMYFLVAGGRRYTAITHLRKTHPTFLDEVPVVVSPITNWDDHKELELEENIRRKQMSWQERVRGISQIYKIRVTKAHSAGESWSRRQLGELLQIDQFSVQYALRLADHIEAGDQEIIDCVQITDAIQLLIKRKRVEVESFQAAVQKAQLAARKEKRTKELANGTSTGTSSSSGAVAIVPQGASLESLVQANEMIHCSSAFDLPLRTAQFDGAYFDIPYGIDMDNLELKHIDITKEQHDVEENISLFKLFLELCWRTTKVKTFTVFWCDMIHLQTLTTLAEAVGYRVQSWPLIAKKESSCKNSAASYNTTKDYEILLVCAKPGATLQKPVSTSFVPYRWLSGERDKFTHPFVKPFSAHKHILENFFPVGSTLLDPCCGEGSGPMAMYALDRIPYGIELVELHANRAKNHLARLITTRSSLSK